MKHPRTPPLDTRPDHHDPAREAMDEKQIRAAREKAAEAEIATLFEPDDGEDLFDDVPV